MSVRMRRHITVRGVVQGVGFRPFVYATAARLALSGSVANDSNGVHIEIEGAQVDLDRFSHQLRNRPPRFAMIEQIDETDVPTRGGTDFRIIDTTRHEGGRTLASPDLALCTDCASELRDPLNRRYRHPFITCTNCGPRFTIIAGLPYDRDRTSMVDFAMCAACMGEYTDPTERRFHAQSIACPDCGPILDYAGLGSGDPLTAARALLAAGGILAVKGIGGYHLACDAENDAAVGELRRRKCRGDKPFAVMTADLADARTIVRVDNHAARLLSGPQRPILLLPRGRGLVADAVAPRNPDLGVLLAYTPLHVLLFGLPGDPPGPRLLVMTSGNLGGEPIYYDDADAHARLAGLADGILSHNRRILVPCDDSVIRPVGDVDIPIRRSRGYAPLPLSLPMSVPATLAVGADLKNTCAVADGRYAWLSQHIGDMDDEATLRAFDAAACHLSSLTGVKPDRLVADVHPGYRSAGWACRRAAGRPVHTVQHHHAHVAAVMGEHGLEPDAGVVGIVFDGTGFGPDAAVWGGEMLIAGYKGYRRAAHLRYVGLPGGDAGVRRPYRMALAHLRAAGIDWSSDIASVAVCGGDERAALAHQLATGLNCVPTSSMGRLFDAVASLVGLRHVVDYEAQAAIELEAAARGIDPGPGTYRFAIDTAVDPMVVDPAPVVTAVVADRAHGVGPDVVAARFHEAVAALVCRLARVAERPDLPVVLSGGVFQNAELLIRSRRLLTAAGFRVLSPKLLPPNDGGIAFGQLLAAGAA